MTPTIPLDLIAPIYNPATFTRPDEVDRIFERLRREHPLAVADVPGYDPHWIVTKYEDVREISRQDELFHSGDRSKMLVSQAGEQLIRQFTGGSSNIFKMLVHLDPPEHGKYRAVTGDMFKPQSIALLQEQVRKTARHFVDDLAARAPACDFAADVAFFYPLRVICNVIGIPEEDHARMLRLTQWLFSYADPELHRPGADPTDPLEHTLTWKMVYDEFNSYYSDVIEDRQRQPRADFATAVVNGRIDGQPMDHRAMVSYLVIASTAGHDTTSATTGMSMWVLAQRPDLLAQLKADLSLVPAFIEESIRWTTPVKHFVRSATTDYILRGQKIAKGDLLYLSYISANRDEEIFTDPYSFRLDRKPNRHIGFGYGGHICLGQHLARLEMKTFWEELLPRLDSVELDGEPKLAVADLVCGPKSIPVRFRMQ
ncbi:MAG: cytochrome P450 [Zavarzinia sp.]|nr:cytochrome P450 [Zavarzinia sp.]